MKIIAELLGPLPEKNFTAKFRTFIEMVFYIILVH